MSRRRLPPDGLSGQWRRRRCQGLLGGTGALAAGLAAASPAAIETVASSATSTGCGHVPPSSARRSPTMGHALGVCHARAASMRAERLTIGRVTVCEADGGSSTAHEYGQRSSSESPFQTAPERHSPRRARSAQPASSRSRSSGHSKGSAHSGDSGAPAQATSFRHERAHELLIHCALAWHSPSVPQYQQLPIWSSVRLLRRRL